MDVHNFDVLVVGGGFGGITVAKKLDKILPAGTTIGLISSNDCFEYYPALHSMLSEMPEDYISVPLSDVFSGTRVQVFVDTAEAVSSDRHTVTGSSQKTYAGKYVVFALGSQAEYFGIPGLRDMAFGFKSVAEAQRIREHIESLFINHGSVAEKKEQTSHFHVVVVGGGPAGVDIAGELGHYMRTLADQYGVPQGSLTVDLIETAPRVLPMMSEHVTEIAVDHLRDLGVNIMTNRVLHSQGLWTTEFEDMRLNTKTLIWTAGIRANEFFEKNNFTLGKKKRATVNEYLEVVGSENVYAIGDSADTQYSGLAQTALYDAEFIASHISKKMSGKSVSGYKPHKNAYILGVGPHQAILVVGNFVHNGWLAYVARKIVDFKFFCGIIPFSKALKLFLG
jgi:NADH dehydrogenase